jgi:hypothetical protein
MKSMRNTRNLRTGEPYEFRGPGRAKASLGDRARLAPTARECKLKKQSGGSGGLVTFNVADSSSRAAGTSHAGIAHSESRES